MTTKNRQTAFFDLKEKGQMRIALTLQYNGKNFCGWQMQKNGRSVQGEVERALSDLYQSPCTVKGVGRTDEGVHARKYVCHFDTQKVLEQNKIVSGLNRFLPADVSVIGATEVSDLFDARKSALSKTYVYKLYVSPCRMALLDENHLQLYKMIDTQLLERGASLFVGQHDFCAFAKVGSNAKTTVRTINSIEVNVSQGVPKIEIVINGNAFLYNMVRNIVGCLLFLCWGKMTEDDIAQMLEEGRRTVHFKTVSGKALELFDVQYPQQFNL